MASTCHKKMQEKSSYCLHLHFYFRISMAQEENEEDFPGRLLHQAALWGNAELLEDLLHGEMVRIY